jgi:hypothetical protein
MCEYTYIHTTRTFLISRLLWVWLVMNEKRADARATSSLTRVKDRCSFSSGVSLRPCLVRYIHLGLN